ncbi:MAG: NUDIX hydrolase [Candidatus Calescibacterium sp.]|nr:NUDIX hydrolase [Candidatus Calescibacterium sp.]MCX7734757.1 NUDIX hydrolase [bacterium]MDW8088102.1 NUDIX hydrolase [Candidatus Calescibacterium sp.]
MNPPKTPYLTVDAVIEYGDQIILIERGKEPYGYALPGGFVEIGEDVKSAVIREIKEETNLDIDIKGVLGIYSDPKRDPRGHTVTVVFVCSASTNQKPISGDDAKKVMLFDLSNIPTEKLVFDHSQIIIDYTEWKKNKKFFIR